MQQYKLINDASNSLSLTPSKISVWLGAMKNTGHMLQRERPWFDKNLRWVNQRRRMIQQLSWPPSIKAWEGVLQPHGSGVFRSISLVIFKALFIPVSLFFAWSPLAFNSIRTRFDWTGKLTEWCQYGAHHLPDDKPLRWLVATGSSTRIHSSRLVNMTSSQPGCHCRCHGHGVNLRMYDNTTRLRKVSAYKMYPCWTVSHVYICVARQPLFQPRLFRFVKRPRARFRLASLNEVWTSQRGLSETKRVSMR